MATRDELYLSNDELDDDEIGGEDMPNEDEVDDDDKYGTGDKDDVE